MIFNVTRSSRNSLTVHIIIMCMCTLFLKLLVAICSYIRLFTSCISRVNLIMLMFQRKLVLMIHHSHHDHLRPAASNNFITKCTYQSHLVVVVTAIEGIWVLGQLLQIWDSWSLSFELHVVSSMFETCCNVKNIQCGTSYNNIIMLRGN